MSTVVRSGFVQVLSALLSEAETIGSFSIFFHVFFSPIVTVVRICCTLTRTSLYMITN